MSNRIPDSLDVNAHIFVDQDIAKAGNPSPWNFRVGLRKR